MKAFFVIVVLSLVSMAYGDEATTPAAATESPCAAKFKEDPKRVNISQLCVNQTGLKPEDLPQSEDDFKKTFEDKCYGKCLLTELGMLKDLKFDHDAIKADILEHVLDKDFQTKITDYTNKCLTDTEKTAATKDNICKLSAELLYCCKKEEQKLPC